MPHVDLDFREPPLNAVGIAPSSLASSKVAEALALELPKDIRPRADKPVARAGPRRRTFHGIRIKERPINMGKWDVSPYKMEEELGVR